MSSKFPLGTAVGDALQLLFNFSLPLYFTDDFGRPIQFGTGFFVRGRDAHYLVSAAHVLDTAYEREVFYYVSSARTRVLTGETTRSGKSQVLRLQDNIDIGVVRLAGDHQPPHPAVSKFAMEAHYLQPRYLPRAGRSYAMLGFPATRSKVSRADRTVSVAPHAFRCEPVPDAEYPQHGFSTNDHLLLYLDRKVGFGEQGDKRTFPKPQGMSGSPVVVLYSDGVEDNARAFPVVAVAVEYRPKQRLLVATDVSYVIEAIEGPLGGRLAGA